MPRKRKQQHHSCTQMRRKLVTHGSMHMLTGAYTEGHKEWRDESCAVPLFSDEERERGTCRSCYRGWEHPNNYPADRPQPTTERYVPECERDGWSENPEAHAAFKRHFG